MAQAYYLPWSFPFRSSRLGLGVAASWLLTIPVVAQTTLVETRPQRGFLSTATKQLSDVDTIDMVNGAVSLRIPMASLPPGPVGRGFGIDLIYNSNLYDVVVGKRSDPNTGNDVYTQELVQSGTGGWHYNFDNIHLEFENRTPPPGYDNWPCSQDPNQPPVDLSQAQRTFRVRIGLPDGSLHVLHLRGKETTGSSTVDGFYPYYLSGQRTACASLAPNLYPADLTGTLTYYTNDGSFLKFETQAGTSPQPWTLYFPDGSRYVRNADATLSMIDANGNAINISGVCTDGPSCNKTSVLVTDSANRQITLLRGPTADTVTGLGYTFQPPYWNIFKSTVAIGGSGYNYECAPNFYCNLTFFHSTISSISVPTTPSFNYGFTYSGNSSQGFGEVKTFTMPYGAQVQYDWSQEGQLTYSSTAVLWREGL